jgi:ubiquinone/menaquinone biosynthesis C-methylase UbiE
MIKRIYEEHVLPPLLDVGMRVSVIAEQREKLVPRATGRVLEIGIGSGLNLPYYDDGRVTSLYGLDPSAQLERRARLRAARCSFPVEVVEGSAEQIPCADGSFDTVLSTYTLCSIADLRAALREIRRVLKPGGAYLFSEHGLAPERSVAGWQHALTPAWKHVAGGCHLHLPMAELIREAGFRIMELHEGYLPGPRPVTYNYRGVAR